jgi:hypothetical protein
MITALVQFKLPQPVTREKAQQLFVGTAPKYRETSGLIRKYYLLSEDGGRVRIDARVGGIRASLGFDSAEVKKVEKKDLPPGFFDPPPAAARVSDATRFRPGQPLYLEVPIIGVFGKDVVADGIRSVLIYAKAHGIPHLVFSIDSAGGDIDEAIEIYRRLQENKKHFKYHSIVRRCQGDALAVAVWSDTLRLVPGGVLGGGIEDVSAPGKKGKPADAEDAEEMEILWARIAHKVVTETERTGRQAEIVRALLDPGVRFAAWRDKEGAVRTGLEPPAGAQVIVACAQGKSLEISYEQAVACGMPEFKGEAQDLGAALRLEGWTAESDYGLKVMREAALGKQRRTDQAQASYEAKASKNISRREETDRFIGDAIKEAQKWDPTKGSYETYSQHWNSGWGWSGGSAVEWTEESQKKWRTRADATLFYLQQAAKGLRSMKKLEAEAVKLKLDPMFKPGELDGMLRDLEVRFAALKANRTKTGE